MPSIDNGDTKNQYEQSNSNASSLGSHVGNLAEKAIKDKVKKKAAGVASTAKSGSSVASLVSSAFNAFASFASGTLLFFVILFFVILTIAVSITMFLTGKFEFALDENYPEFTQQLENEIYAEFWDVANTSIGLEYETKNPNIKYKGQKIIDLIEPYMKEQNLFPYDGVSNWIVSVFNSPKPNHSKEKPGYTYDGNNNEWDTFHADINFNPSLIEMTRAAYAYATAIDSTVMYFSTPEEFNTQYTPDKSLQVDENWEVQKGTEIDSRLDKPMEELSTPKQIHFKDTITYQDENNHDMSFEVDDIVIDHEVTQSAKDGIKEQTSNVNGLKGKDGEFHSDFYFFLRNEKPQGKPIYEYKQVEVSHWYGEADNFIAKVVDEYGIRGTFTLTFDYQTYPDMLIAKGFITQEEYDKLDDLPANKKEEELDKLIYPSSDYRYYLGNKNYLLTTVASEEQNRWMQIKADEINPDYTSIENVKEQVGTLEIDERRWKREQRVFEISSDTTEWSNTGLDHTKRTELEVHHYQEWYDKSTGKTANLDFKTIGTQDHTYENGKEVNLGNYGLRDSDRTYTTPVVYDDYSTSIDIPYTFNFSEYKENLLNDKAEEMVGKGRCIPDTLTKEYSNTCTLEEANEMIDTVKTNYIQSNMMSLGIDLKYIDQMFGLSDLGFDGEIDYIVGEGKAYFDYKSNKGFWLRNSAVANEWFAHANYMHNGGISAAKGSGAAWTSSGIGGCTLFAEVWFYDVYGERMTDAGSGNGCQVATNVVNAKNTHPGKFVLSSSPAPGAIMSYGSSPGHVICIDAVDEASDRIWISQGAASLKAGELGSIEIRGERKLSEFKAAHPNAKYAVPVK